MSKTILYVEDNPANLRLVEKIIEKQTEYSMLSAPDASAGIDIAENKQPDLVLMDISLPGMDGYQALQKMQENELTRHIPVIAISANAMPNDMKRGKQAGFIDYLTKPFDISELVSAIESTLACGQTE